MSGSVEPFILTTWDSGPGANARGFPVLADGGSALDAVETSLTNAVSQARWEKWAAKNIPTDAFDPEPMEIDRLNGQTVKSYWAHHCFP
jgi:hypothetical protein